MDNLTDEYLVRLYLKDNDNEALDNLVQRYFKHIYNFIAKYIGDTKEAEDLTQESFLKAWKSLKSFDQARSFKVWLFQIARNCCIDYFRRKKIPVFSALEKPEDGMLIADSLEDPAEPLELRVEKNELKREIKKYLARLPEPNRAVILLYYNQQMNFREISELLGEPLDTIKSRHRRGLILLKKLISESQTNQKTAFGRI